MDVVTDHSILLKRFEETLNDLQDAEKTFKILHPYSRGENLESFEQSKRDYVSCSSFKDISTSCLADKQSPSKDSSESSEESISEEDFPSKKVSLKSTVVTKRSSESRKNVIFKQNQKVQSRNRRILGMLQSTLQKFQDDSVKRQPQDLKRIRMEEKIEAAKEEEKQRLVKEKIELSEKIKEKKLQLDCLKQMMQITESFAIWKHNKKKLLNFIITEAKPHICFLPASHTPSSRKWLERSRIEIQEDLLNKETAIQKELTHIKETYAMEFSTEDKSFASNKTMLDTM